MEEKILIECPDCEGGGKKFKYWEMMGLFQYSRGRVKTDKDCERCDGLGKIRVNPSKIKEE